MKINRIVNIERSRPEYGTYKNVRIKSYSRPEHGLFVTDSFGEGPRSMAALGQQIIDGTGVLINSDVTAASIAINQEYRLQGRKPLKERYSIGDTYDLNLDLVQDRDTGFLRDAITIVENKTNEAVRNENCPLTEEEQDVIRSIYMLWCGRDINVTVEYLDGVIEERDLTLDEMIDQIGLQKEMFRTHYNRIFGIAPRSILGFINSAMSDYDLQEYYYVDSAGNSSKHPIDEDHLMAYVMLMHINVDRLQDLQTRMQVKYDKLRATSTDDQLRAIQAENEETFMSELRAVILDFRVRMADNFRKWTWIEDVLLGNIGEVYPEYPGIDITSPFEPAGQIAVQGIDTYYLRVGEATREELMNKFTYVELYYLAGSLALGYEDDIDFSTEQSYENVADTIIFLLDRMQIDPRHILTPFGVRIIVNAELTENIYNFNRKILEHNSEELYLCCQQQGIETGYEDGFKDQIVLVEELISAYLTPTFYTHVEQFRATISAVEKLKTIGGDDLFFENNIDYLFYGIGDGVSFYKPYRLKELIDTFTELGAFYEPYSMLEHVGKPALWVKFPHRVLRRLVNFILPKWISMSGNDLIEARARDSFALSQIINTILTNGERTYELELSPQDRQSNIAMILHNAKPELEVQLVSFFLGLFNLGAQLSDWEESMLGISDKAILEYMQDGNFYEYVDPETTVRLKEKIFYMLTSEISGYYDKLKLRNGTDLSSFVGNLRLIKYYDDEYKLEWYDEMMTIDGFLNLMVRANSYSYNEYLRIGGNWLISTSHYYLTKLLDKQLGDTELELLD